MSGETPNKSPQGIIFGLLAALLFGLSTPLAKILTGDVDPVLLAGLLYLGSGIGLSAWWIFKRRRQPQKHRALKRAELPWLAGAVVCGGILSPALLMVGLSLTMASTASLLLNLEGVLTALLAWVFWKENCDRRVVAGMFAITCGGILLSVAGQTGFAMSWGSLLICLACLGWAVDNNLTRHISAADATEIALIKGLVAGVVNLSIALAILGAKLPSLATIGSAMTIGFLGYGVSLALFVLALRHLGTARTGAYFSMAPFVGALVSVLVLKEPLTLELTAASLLMGLGLWLHLTEKHEHPHHHKLMVHEHEHVHDEHHQHEHSPADPPGEPHSHAHTHKPMSHSHPHFPDLHHRHDH